MRKWWLAYLRLTVCFLVVFVLGGGCGYRMGSGSLLPSRASITIPYVEEDWKGLMTSALVHEVARSSSYVYKDRGGLYTLFVTDLQIADDHIGFRYDRNKQGQFKSRIIPTETRLIASATVRLVETYTGTLLLGPVRLQTDVDFDHDYYDNRDSINVFSLGQLTDYEEAYDAATRPLFERFAKQIVDYLDAARSQSY